MNCVAVTGTVLAAPLVQEHEKSGEHVWVFNLAIDKRHAKRPTEVTIACWREVGRFLGKYLVPGDRVAVLGSLSHMSGKGLVLAASQLARITEEVSANEQPKDAAAQSDPDETNWASHLHLGSPGARR